MDKIRSPNFASLNRRRLLKTTAAALSTTALPTEGDTVLTLISDDNFSMIQRTLLLQFTLLE